MALPAASNHKAEGSSMAGWVFGLHLDLRIAHYSRWLLKDVVITGHVGHPIPKNIPGASHRTGGHNGWEERNVRVI